MAIPKIPPILLKAMLPDDGCVGTWKVQVVQANPSYTIGASKNSPLVPIWNSETNCVESWAVKIVFLEV